MTSEISSSFQKILVPLSLPLFSFTQWKDKCASYSFTTKKLTHSLCQVSLVVKYITCNIAARAKNRFVFKHNLFTNQDLGEGSRALWCYSESVGTLLVNPFIHRANANVQSSGYSNEEPEGTSHLFWIYNGFATNLLIVFCQLIFFFIDVSCSKYIEKAKKVSSYKVSLEAQIRNQYKFPYKFYPIKC